MSLTISAAQRDALYDQIAARLSAIGDVWIAFAAGDFETTRRLGRLYSDELRLLTDDLGWGERRDETIELTAPPDVLRRALRSLHDAAVAEDASRNEERAELREAEARTRLVMETCGQILAEL